MPAANRKSVSIPAQNDCHPSLVHTNRSTTPGRLPINCDNDRAATNGGTKLEFAAPKSRQFLVVVDGVNGARGIVHLNYRLDTNRPPVAPTLMQVPATRRVAAGTDVNFQPDVIGSAPLHFSWRKETNPISGATNGALILTGVAPINSGDYFLTISNHVGSPLNVLMPLRVLVQSQLQVAAQAGNPWAISIPTVAGQSYILDHTDSLGGTWQPWTNSFVGDGSFHVLSNDFGSGTHFFRVRLE